ncbi:hypothetical protein GGP41_010565 [Bipolaris sorokiniana]|uniref:Uncharacterized protein n=1 Tax=Cochliobolus sativus TaxID=45130 RepID=A0A8H5ZKT7_COCSA|nr:hypothetical protein GGP41_010565 [Bipolaris sorokiniana]
MCLLMRLSPWGWPAGDGRIAHLAHALLARLEAAILLLGGWRCLSAHVPTYLIHIHPPSPDNIDLGHRETLSTNPCTRPADVAPSLVVILSAPSVVVLL